MIETMFPTLPRIELFARERFEGWDAWGNELQEAAE
jgi:N6-adenosine-specific RNA methylase IME4